MKAKATILIMVMIGAAFVTAIVPTATAKVTPNNCLETEGGTWCSETVLSDSQKYDGVNIGDADNDGKIEILGVGLSGKVWMAKYVNKEWVTSTIWTNSGELLLPYVGDADNDGKNEVVVVGMVAGPEADTGAGQVTMLKGSGTQWVATRLHTDGYMVHGVAIGEFDPDHPGNEVVVGTFGWNMTEIALTNGQWVVTQMMHATPVAPATSGKVRTVMITDVDADGKNEVLAASKNWEEYIVKKVGATWTNTSIYKDTGGLARTHAGDYDGDGVVDIVGSGDSKNLVLMKRSGTTWTGSVIFTDSDQMRGAQIYDVYDGHAGNEIVGAGYSGNVTLHYQVGTTWKHILVFHDTGRLHDVKVADVNGDGKLELITGGYSNKVTVVSLKHPDFSADITPKGYKVIEKTEVAFTVTMTSVDFYTDSLAVVVEGLPTGATATVASTPVQLISDKAIVTVTVKVPPTVANGNTTFTIKVTGAAGTKTVSGYLDVLRTITPSIKEPAAGQTVKVGKSVIYSFVVENKGNVADTFALNATTSNGFAVTMSSNKTALLQPGANETVTLTMTIPKNTKAKTDVLTLKATSNYDGKTVASKTVTTTVKAAAKPTGICTTIIWAGIILSVGMVGVVGYLRPRRE
jgi:hypothetical protein